MTIRLHVRGLRLGVKIISINRLWMVLIAYKLIVVLYFFNCLSMLIRAILWIFGVLFPWSFSFRQPDWTRILRHVMMMLT